MAFKNYMDKSNKGYSGNNRNIEKELSSDHEVLEEKKLRDSVKQEYDMRKANIRKLSEYKLNLENNNIKLGAKEEQRILKDLSNLSLKQQRENAKKAEKEVHKLRLESLKEEAYQQLQNYKKLQEQGEATIGDWAKAVGAHFKSIGANLAGRMAEGFKELFSSENVNQMMSTYGKYQEAINTRIQGTGTSFQKLQANLLTSVGVNPYVKTSNMLNSLQSLVEQGIAFNLEQRAFLASISDKIATTFDAANSSLLRIVKLQQQDSTASRLGMEAYMTRFLNNMFQNTEYLTNEFDSVTGALTEAISQMTTEMGVEFEYMVQKWLGSLSSVGLSSTTVNNLAQAIGYLASGNISGLEGSGMQNLLVMAANRAGLDYGAIMGRLSLEDTNSLLKSVVEYLSEIGSNTNQVVKNQYAQTFGVSVSDLTAAKNIGDSIGNIYNNVLSYVGSIQELQYQATQIAGRTSIASMIETLTDNVKYSILSTIAASPTMSALWRLTSFSKELSDGGIPVPFLGGTVEGYIQGALIGESILGALGDIINGVGNTFNFANALSLLGIDTGLVGTQRGSGIEARTSGFGTSQSTYLGQSSGGAFYEGSVQSLKEEYAAEEKTASDIYKYLEGDVVKVRLQEVSEDATKLDILSNIENDILELQRILREDTLKVTVDNLSPFPMGA